MPVNLSPPYGGTLAAEQLETNASEKPSPALVELMLRAHDRFIAALDVFRLENLSPEAMRCEIRAAAEAACEQVCREPGVDSDEVQHTWTTDAVLDEAFGLGPLEQLLQSPCDAILIRGPRDIWIEQNGRVYETAAVFADEEHLQRTLRRYAPLRDCVRPDEDGRKTLRLDVQQLRRTLNERTPESESFPAAHHHSVPQPGFLRSFWSWLLRLGH